jgi:hypothetical protein
MLNLWLGRLVVLALVLSLVVAVMWLVFGRTA